MRSSRSLDRLDGAPEGMPLVADAGVCSCRPRSPGSSSLRRRSPVAGHRGLRVMTDSQPDGSRTWPGGRVTADSVRRGSRTTCSANWPFGRQALIGPPRTEPLVTHGRDHRHHRAQSGRRGRHGNPWVRSHGGSGLRSRWSSAPA